MPEAIPIWLQVVGYIVGPLGAYYAARAQQRNAQTNLFQAVQSAAQDIIKTYSTEIGALRARVEVLERELESYDRRFARLRTLVRRLIEALRAHDQAAAEEAERALRDIEEDPPALHTP